MLALSSKSPDPLMTLPYYLGICYNPSQVSDVDLPKSLISSQSHTPFSEDHDVILSTYL
jgi:hypothetical protein